MSADDLDELYGLLVPLDDERLLVPRACVAEVVAWSQPEEMPGAPAWYAGTVGWNGRSTRTGPSSVCPLASPTCAADRRPPSGQ